MTARGCLFVLFATAAFAAQAVEFDEKLKAPMAASLAWCRQSSLTQRKFVASFIQSIKQRS